jgi:AbrB family looped-hinge helix DNA binding protein
MVSRTSRRITRKGQITIPSEMREHLNLHEGDPVTFELKGDIIVLTPQSVTDRTAGAIQPRRKHVSAEHERRSFEEELAREADRKD